MTWLVASMITVLFWGIVGLLQKMGSNHGTSNSLFVWTTVGYALLLPFLIAGSHLNSLPARSIMVGVVCGATNALGAWALYTALERGARASVAVPLTSLYPLVTLILALIVLGERLTVLQTAGVVLALAAGVLLSYEPEAR
jgi:transporter family protein